VCETPDCVAHIKCTGLISGHLCGDCNGLKEGDRHHLNSWSSGSSAIWRIISYSYNCSACHSLLLHNLPIYRFFDFFPGVPRTFYWISFFFRLAAAAGRRKHDLWRCCHAQIRWEYQCSTFVDVGLEEKSWFFAIGFSVLEIIIFSHIRWDRVRVFHLFGNLFSSFWEFKMLTTFNLSAIISWLLDINISEFCRIRIFWEHQLSFFWDLNCWEHHCFRQLDVGFLTSSSVIILGLKV